MKKHITASMTAALALIATQALAAGPDKYSIGISTSGNYIHTRTYTAADASRVYDDVAYYSGLGLLSHTVQVAASPDGRSIVLPVYHNALFNDRERQYLPFEAQQTNAASFNYPLADSNFAFYGSADAPFAYTLNEMEPSALGRVKRTYKPGATYRDAGKYIAYDYGVNAASEVLKLSFAAGAVTANGYYAAAELFRNTVTDEDGGQIITFVDKLDNVVLERRKIADNNFADTYYVYDNSRRLVCVAPPEAAKALTSASASITAANVAALCYTYTYVGDRVVRKQLPGRQTEYFGYDLGNRPILYQDGNMAAAGKAVMYRYDRCGRIEQMRIGNFSGTISSSAYPDSAQESMMGQLNITLALYKYDKTDSTQFAIVEGIVEKADRDDNVQSLKTYEKIAVLGDNYTAAGYVERWFYYDYRGRIIQTVEKYPDASLHRISTKYDFTGNVIVSRVTYTHGATTETLDRTFSYDNRGRLLAETSTIGGVTASVGYSYDAVGRLKGKSYSNGTITETLTYNTQGWQTAQTVKKGEEVLFANTLNYYTGTTPLYSGNISEWSWNHKGQTANTYKFSYDKMSRLLGAEHFEGTSEQSTMYTNNLGTVIPDGATLVIFTQPS